MSSESAMKSPPVAATRLSNRADATELPTLASRSQGKMALRQFRRNPGAMIGLVLLILIAATAIFADQLMPYDPNDIEAALRRAAPSSEAWLGRDELGRDMLSRLILGSRVALTTAVLAVGIGMVVGVVVGIIAGYTNGRTDTLLSLVIDLMLAFPSLLLAIVIVAALGPGLRNTALAIGISSIPIFARVVRGSTISVGRNEYVEAARAVGSRPPRIMFRHILPNILAPITVIATIQLARAILYEASLSFLGLGAQPPTPSWGAMAAAGRRFLQSDPHIVLVPSAAIMVTVLAFNLFGDGLRDALDPRLRTSD